MLLKRFTIFSEELEFDPEKFKQDFRQMQTELKEESAHLRDQSEKLKGLSYTIRYDSSWKKLKGIINRK